MKNLKSNKINVDEIIKSCRVFNIQELMYLLKADIRIFLSWGCHNFIVDNTKNTKMFRMTVQGHHHKGYVYIFLNGLDLFDVYLTSNQGTIKYTITGLYFDQLVEVIDNKIERIPEYVN